MGDMDIHLQPTPATPDRQVRIGWDHHLQTFYTSLAVEPDTDHLDETAHHTGLSTGPSAGSSGAAGESGASGTGTPVVVYRVGTTVGEIPDPGPAIEVARRFALVPDHVQDLLTSGQDSTQHTTIDLRTPLHDHQLHHADDPHDPRQHVGHQYGDRQDLDRQDAEHLSDRQHRDERMHAERTADMGFGFG